MQLVYAQESINASKSIVNFEVSNMGFKTVEGTFSGMSGLLKFNPEDPVNAVFKVCVDAKTVNTGNKKRDEHLRTDDFFHVEKFPSICIKSKQINKTSNGYTLDGTLIMHGVSKEVSIPFTYSDKTFSGKVTIDRTDFNVGSDGGFMVGQDVELEIVCVLN